MAKTIANLKVIQGSQKGKRIEVKSDITILGRDPRRADVLVYRPNQRSSVSGRHCTLIYERGAFFIIDHSKAGTFLNGEYIPPEERVALEDGDELLLGRLDRLGALLKFYVGAPPDSESVGDDFSNKYKDAIFSSVPTEPEDEVDPHVTHFLPDAETDDNDNDDYAAFDLLETPLEEEEEKSEEDGSWLDLL